MNSKPKTKNARNSLPINLSPNKNKRASNIASNSITQNNSIGVTLTTNEKELPKNVVVYDRNSKMKATSKILETYKKMKIENQNLTQEGENEIEFKKTETESKEKTDNTQVNNTNSEAIAKIKKNSLIQNRENFLKELKQNIKIKKEKDLAAANANANANTNQNTNVLSNSITGKKDKKSSINKNIRSKKVETTSHTYVNTSFDRQEEVIGGAGEKENISSARNAICVNVLKSQLKSNNENLSKIKNSLTKGIYQRDTSVKDKKPNILFNLNMKGSLLVSNYDSDGVGNKLNISLNQKKSLLSGINTENYYTPKKRNLFHNNISNLKSAAGSKLDDIYKSKEDSEFFEYEDDKKEELTNDEKLVYGNREPKDYKKIKLIGKGGCGIVWLCQDNEGNEYAIKQISKKSNKPESLRESNVINMNTIIVRKEIEILTSLNSEIDNQEENYMVTLKDYIEDCSDIWLVFEKGGRSLSNLVFKIKGEFLGNERIYSIKKGRFLMHLFENIENFKKLMRQLLLFINFLNSNGIVHCDIKPENILIDFDTEKDGSLKFNNVKMIDFGSAFFISNPENFNSNTPEYMSPEITDLVEKNASAKDTGNFLKKLIDFPWCIDMWSLGVTILEIVLSCPLWMSYKAKVVIHGKTIYKTGLFGVKGRNGSKIHSKQIEVANSVPKLMNESLIINETDRLQLTDLLTKMLDLNYKTRISPVDALNHPFLKVV